MIRIPTLIDALRVMEDGEELHHLEVRARFLRQAKTVFEDPCPVHNSVDSAPRKRVVLKDDMQNPRDIQLAHARPRNESPCQEPNGGFSRIVALSDP